MITNKDIRVENGNLVLNGDKFPLDGQSPEAIMEIVEDNSDTTPTENSTAPVTSGGVYTALGTKQNALTFDTTPTDESTNPVTSGGLYNTIGDLTLTGVTGASVAAQLEALDDKYIVQGKTLGSSLVVSAGNFVRADIPCEISGYTALGVLSVQGAATAGLVSLMEFGLSADETKIYVYYANDSATDKTLSDVRVRVLYRKN